MRDAASQLVDRPWPAVGKPVLLVPLGSTEQHGPHLPLDTDTIIAQSVARMLGDRLAAQGTDAVVAPALGYGASGEHQDFAGTISIGTAALATLLIEYGRSACGWAQRLIVVNGHGGNVEALGRAIPALRAESREAAWLPCAVRRADADAHAGLVETSIMLAIAPDRVDLDKAQPGATGPITSLLPRLRSQGVRAVAPNGVLGNPGAANAVLGTELLEQMTAAAWSRLSSGAVDARGCLSATGPGGTAG